MLNIDIPKLPEPSIDRIPGLFRIDKPLKKTTRKVILKTSMGKFDWSPSLSYIMEIIEGLGAGCSDKFGDKTLEDGLQTLLSTMLSIDFPRKQMLGHGTVNTFTFEFMNPNGRKIKNVKLSFDVKD